MPLRDDLPRALAEALADPASANRLDLEDARDVPSEVAKPTNLETLSITVPWTEPREVRLPEELASLSRLAEVWIKARSTRSGPGSTAYAR